MSEDISQDLKDMAHIIDIAQGRAEFIMTNSSMLQEAHEEIERLRNAGDALVAAIRNRILLERDIRAWEEARRG